MAEPAETVAVVVVTHNRADLLARMLDALVLQTYPIATVIVVDNASGDHTPQVLAKIEDGGDLPLTMIRSEENVGGAGGLPWRKTMRSIAAWPKKRLTRSTIIGVKCWISGACAPSTSKVSTPPDFRPAGKRIDSGELTLA